MADSFSDTLNKLTAPVVCAKLSQNPNYIDSSLGLRCFISHLTYLIHIKLQI